jgi:hypothetical protein
LLATHDPTLYDHLTGLGIEPQLFALRWVRVCFGREFGLADVLLLWDGIFAYSEGQGQGQGQEQIFLDLPLIPYVCVAMLMFIRTSLIGGDEMTCMRKLQVFPQMDDHKMLLKMARYLRDSGGAATYAGHASNASKSKQESIGYGNQDQAVGMPDIDMATARVGGATEVLLSVNPAGGGSSGSMNVSTSARAPGVAKRMAARASHSDRVQAAAAAAAAAGPEAQVADGSAYTRSGNANANANASGTGNRSAELPTAGPALCSGPAAATYQTQKQSEKEQELQAEVLRLRAAMGAAGRKLDGVLTRLPATITTATAGTTSSGAMDSARAELIVLQEVREQLRLEQSAETADQDTDDDTPVE